LCIHVHYFVGFAVSYSILFIHVLRLQLFNSQSISLQCNAYGHQFLFVAFERLCQALTMSVTLWGERAQQPDPNGSTEAHVS
jgi:hypothetical protein